MTQAETALAETVANRKMIEARLQGLGRRSRARRRSIARRGAAHRRRPGDDRLHSSAP